MRKIDKTKILSTVYKKWEEELEKTKKAHPKYNSSDHKYYDDIVMNLFCCQKGLCAYTEQLLCPKKYYESSLWKNGRYQGQRKGNVKGQLEHFDEKLKTKKADEEGRKDWLWDNFFMIDTDINNLKGVKEVDYILKPDNPNYNEGELLEYNSKSHIFIAKTTLSKEKRIRINNMLNKVLFVNHGAVIAKRKQVIRQALKVIEFGIENSNYQPIEFPTAFEMSKKKE